MNFRSTMQRLLLVATVGALATVAVPMSSANAAEFKGQCGTGTLEKIKGTATFSEKKLSETEQTGIAYSFVAKKKGECEEEGTKAKRKVELAEVTGGTFKGTCLGKGKSETEGAGTLELSNPKASFSFKLGFESEKGKVSLEIGPSKATEKTATGEATFFASVEEPAIFCSLFGVKKLEFEAEAKGTI